MTSPTFTVTRQMAGKLYLIPTPLDTGRGLSYSQPEEVGDIIASLRHYVVEELRTARRFIGSLKRGIDINGLSFTVLNEHTPQEDIDDMLRPALDGFDMGLMSEAGVPAVADPGAGLVAAAHRRGIKVVPLVGASSIIMSLMASGLTGQTFSFNGYIPVKEEARRAAIARMERAALSDGYSQIFIEAPYRNDKLLETLLKTLSPAVRLTVACDITSVDEYIRTDTVAGWRKTNIPTLHKRPAIFIIGR